MTAFLRETLGILNEAAPYLLLGFLLAGVLDALLKRYRHLTQVLTSPGRRPIWLAALLGVPLPLCSCSVLPAALTLRRQGASKGTTASFLISVPETDVTSIALTYALLGPIMAVARPLAAVVTAVTTGLIIDRLDPSTRPVGPADTPEDIRRDPNPNATHRGPEEAGESARVARSGGTHWVLRALRFGFVEMFDDIIVQLVVGILIAGAIVAWLPGLGLDKIMGGSPVTYLIMLGIGIPVYVCATASTPLALGFVAGGVSPGAALVFLLAGPATNVASLIVLSRQFGRRVLALYVVTLAVASIAMGVLLDTVFGRFAGVGTKVLAIVTEPDGAALPTVPAVILLVLIGVSLHRTKPLSKWMTSLQRRNKKTSR